MSDIAAIHFTAANEEEAQMIVKALVKEKLIACANMFPAMSTYWWKSKIENDKEVLVWMKTKRANFKKIVNRIKELHSYELPVIEMLNSETTPEVEKWIENSLSTKDEEN